MKIRDLSTGVVHEPPPGAGDLPRGSRVARDGPVAWVWHEGDTWRLARVVEKPGASEEEEHGLRAPMPGVVARVLAEEGQAVEKGTPMTRTPAEAHRASAEFARRVFAGVGAD